MPTALTLNAGLSRHSLFRPTVSLDAWSFDRLEADRFEDDLAVKSALQSAWSGARLPFCAGSTKPAEMGRETLRFRVLGS